MTAESLSVTALSSSDDPGHVKLTALRGFVPYTNSTESCQTLRYIGWIVLGLVRSGSTRAGSNSYSDWGSPYLAERSPELEPPRGTLPNHPLQLLSQY